MGGKKGNRTYVLTIAYIFKHKYLNLLLCSQVVQYAVPDKQ